MYFIVNKKDLSKI